MNISKNRIRALLAAGALALAVAPAPAAPKMIPATTSTSYRYTGYATSDIGEGGYATHQMLMLTADPNLLIAS